MDYTAKENFQEGNLTRDKEPALSLPNEKWAQKLKQELVVSGYSTKTMKMYLCYFNEFARAIKKPVEQAERDDVMAFLAEKKEKGNASNATLALAHAALHFFFHKVAHKNIVEDITIAKKAKKLPTVLSKEEIRKLIKAASSGATA